MLFFKQLINQSIILIIFDHRFASLRHHVHQCLMFPQPLRVYFFSSFCLLLSCATSTVCMQSVYSFRRLLNRLCYTQKHSFPECFFQIGSSDKALRIRCSILLLHLFQFKRLPSHRHSLAALALNFSLFLHCPSSHIPHPSYPPLVLFNPAQPPTHFTHRV